MRPPPRLERLLASVVRDPHARVMVLEDLAGDYDRVASRYTRIGGYLWYAGAAATVGWWYFRHRVTGRRRRFINPRSVGGLRTFPHDLKLGARSLRRTPLFTTVAVLTIGLGIGASAAIFSVLYGVVLRPLPYETEGALVRVSHFGQRSGMLGAADAHIYQYGENSASLAAFALYLESSAPADGVDGPTEVGIIQATPSLFSVLEVAPILGRLFTEDDAQPGAPPTAILMHDFWMSRFGGDSTVIGRPLSQRSPIPIVGVLPAWFDFIRPSATITFGNAFDDPGVILPLAIRRSTARLGNFIYQGIGRLQPDATIDDTQRELQELLGQMPELYPGGLTRQMFDDGHYRAVVEPLKAAMLGDVASVLWILMGAVGFVLIIATVNVLNLFVVRTESQRSEIAVRRALGASPGRIARWFLTESSLLAAAGGALGAVIATIGVPMVLRVAPRDIPRLDQVSIDGTVLLFTGLISAAAAVALGIVPMMRFSRLDLARAIGDQSRGSTPGRGQHRVRQGLVVAQVGFALVLLVGSSLLVRTVINLRNVDPGFGAANAMVVRVTLGNDFTDPAARTRWLLQLTERIGALGGVESATFAGDLPLDGDMHYAQFAVPEALPEPNALPPTAARGFVGPGYFAAVGATLLQGREMTRRDYATDPEGVIVNRSFAEQWWPGQDPIGKRTVQWPTAQPDTWYRVIGVVADIHEAGLAQPPEPQVYLPTVFRPGSGYGMFVRNFALIIRTIGPPLTVLPTVRREIDAMQSLVPITAVQTLDGLQAESMRQISFAMLLLVVAGAAALLLGVVGIYGVVAYIAGRRTREIGVRMALGAQRGDVRRMVLRQAAIVGITGVVLGALAALGLGRVLASMLFGVAPTDPATYAGVAALLLALVIGASVVPAVRAAAVDPVRALRCE